MQFSDVRKIEAEYAKRFPRRETDDHWEPMVNADKNLARIALVFHNEEMAKRMIAARVEIYRRHLDANEPIRDWHSFEKEVLSRSGVVLRDGEWIYVEETASD